ncbi:MAG: LacI family DNA-binding transcriptional regulator [Planctomycetota bacterium]
MPITLKDIAERAQVSQATVSIAMGSAGRISDDTRSRILRIAEEMGYRPNLLVHGIQKGRTGTIGVLTQISGDPFEAKLFNGVHRGLVEAGCVPIVLMPLESVSVLDQIHMLIDRRVDGLILRPAAEAMWERHIDEAIDRDVPVVAIDIEPQAETPHVDFIGTDDIGGARLAAERLIDAGHRRIAVITSGTFPDPMLLRSEGFEARVHEFPDTHCVVTHVPWSSGITGYEEAKRVLAMEPRPTAIFVTIDALAGGVYRAAREAGLAIPRDLSVIGFADNPIAELLDPTLSTMRQRPREIGGRAARLLIERIGEGEVHGPRKRILIEPRLIERGSVDVAPANAD